MPSIRVVAAVFVADEKVLACRRAPGRADAGKWEFPGGKVEPGESPTDALAREISEELAIEVRVGDLIDRTTTHMGERQIDLASYWVAGISPTASTDHDRLLWVSPDELSALDWATPDLPTVAQIAAKLRG